MIVISNGLVKSGSTLFRNYTISLLKKIYKKTGQHYLSNIIKKQKYEGFGSHISHISDALLYDTYKYSIQNGPIVIKCHTPYSALIEKWNKPGIHFTYTIRDPRDVLLSAIDHGNRKVLDPSVEAFKHIKTINEAAVCLKPAFQNSVHWVNQRIGTVIRYEDLINNPELILNQLANNILDSDIPSIIINGIVNEERVKRTVGKSQFNKGVSNRFKNELSVDQIKTINNILCNEITGLGYEL